MAWSAILAAPYNSETESVFAISSAGLRRRIEGAYSFEWGIDAPDVAPTVAAGSGTGLTGDYNAKYTYGRAERRTLVCESNPSDAAVSAVTLSNNDLRITATAPSDEQVNIIRFYRTAVDGATYYYTGQLYYCNQQYACTQDWEEDDGYISGIAWRFTIEDSTHSTEDCYTWELLYDGYTFSSYDNVITGLADNELFINDTNTDALLGTTVASDHNRPPENSTFCFGPTDNGTVFVLKQNKAYYSKPQQPEYFPSTYYIDVSSIQFPLICGVIYDTRPYLFTRQEVYYVAGTQFADLPDLTTYRPYPQEAMGGALSSQAVSSVLGIGIFRVLKDGIYRFQPGDTTGIDEKITWPVDPIFRGSTIGGIPAVGDLTYSWLQWYDSQLFFGFPSGSDTYPKNVLVFDFNRKKIKYYSYPTDMSVACHDRYNNRMLACASAGGLYEIEDKDATTDNGTTISWEIQTKDFVLQTRRHYPRWNKYDIDAATADTAYGYSYLSDTLIQTHTLSGDRDTKRRLIDLKNGERFSVKIAGTGAIEIYALESE